MDIFEEFSDNELMVTDIQFLGLRQGAWDFSRGARTQRVYVSPDDANLVHIKDFYTYTMSDGDRNIESYVRKIQWMDADNNVRIEKEITPILNIKNKKRINRDIRQGRIDYMVAAAEELAGFAPHVPEPYKSDFLKATDSIYVIMKQYESAISHYIDTGSKDFEVSVSSESNPVLLVILSLNVRPPDEFFPAGLTIKQSIIHQLTGAY
tara:strand:- start:2616 stop:3239 length:624 start_codon:yes stop_codon:yes gene_type:complete